MNKLLVFLVLTISVLCCQNIKESSSKVSNSDFDFILLKPYSTNSTNCSFEAIYSEKNFLKEFRIKTSIFFNKKTKFLKLVESRNDSTSVYTSNIFSCNGNWDYQHDTIVHIKDKLICFQTMFRDNKVVNKTILYWYKNGDTLNYDFFAERKTDSTNLDNVDWSLLIIGKQSGKRLLERKKYYFNNNSMSVKYFSNNEIMENSIHPSKETIINNVNCPYLYIIDNFNIHSSR